MRRILAKFQLLAALRPSCNSCARATAPCVARHRKAGLQWANWLAGHAGQECPRSLSPCHNIVMHSTAQARVVNPDPDLPGTRVSCSPARGRCRDRRRERSENARLRRVRKCRAARAHSARHSLHDRRHHRVRGLERGLEMAGGELSGRRGAVHPHRGRADHLRRCSSCRIPGSPCFARIAWAIMPCVRCRRRSRRRSCSSLSA